MRVKEKEGGTALGIETTTTTRGGKRWHKRERREKGEGKHYSDYSWLWTMSGREREREGKAI
jgi:hypothetical protein